MRISEFGWCLIGSLLVWGAGIALAWRALT